MFLGMLSLKEAVRDGLDWIVVLFAPQGFYERGTFGTCARERVVG